MTVLHDSLKHTAHTFPEERAVGKAKGWPERWRLHLSNCCVGAQRSRSWGSARSREERMGRGYPIPDLRGFNSHIAALRFEMKVTSWTAVTFSDKTLKM